jgi:hypothetical protein
MDIGILISKLEKLRDDVLGEEGIVMLGVSGQEHPISHLDLVSGTVLIVAESDWG